MREYQTSVAADTVVELQPSAGRPGISEVVRPVLDRPVRAINAK